MSVSGPSSSPSPSPAPSTSRPRSTIASADEHNAYIWTKAKYFSKGQPGASLPVAQQPFRALRSILIISILLITGFFAVNLVLLPLQLIAAAIYLFKLYCLGSHSRWAERTLRASEFVGGSWLSMLDCVLECMLPWGRMELHHSGSVITDDQVGEGAIIISNHPTTADWIYLWSWLIRFGSLNKLKIVLKASLHGAPIIGWGMQCARFLFLTRRWERDEAHMHAIVRHWAGGEERIELARRGGSAVNSVQMLLFPEGTDLRPASYDISQAFQSKPENVGKLEPVKHVLHPRTTGFVHLVQAMRKTGTVKAIYDLTLGSDPVPINIENFATGIIPPKFHVHCQRYDLSSLPTDDSGLAEWLVRRWQEKDARLESFYSRHPNAFPTSPELTKQHEEWDKRHAATLRMKQFALIVGWASIGIAHAYAFMHQPLLMLLLHVVLSLVWVGIGRQWGGIDALVLRLDGEYERRRTGNANTTMTGTNTSNGEASNNNEANGQSVSGDNKKRR